MIILSTLTFPRFIDCLYNADCKATQKVLAIGHQAVESSLITSEQIKIPLISRLICGWSFPEPGVDGSDLSQIS